MINHVVLLKFKPEVRDADIEELAKSLDELPNKIKEIHTYEFGRDLMHSEKSYDFALVSLFANQETLQRYLQHRYHLPVVKKIQELCDNVITVDFEGPDTGSIIVESPSWDFKPI